MIGFQRLNISGSSAARSPLQPPTAERPKIVSSSDPSTSTAVCTASVYATARMPPTTVYSPVRITSSTDPIQKLLNVAPPTTTCTSGSSAPKTTPPAKMPTAILVST